MWILDQTCTGWSFHDHGLPPFFVLQIATSVLHFCPWIPNNVRRLLYCMGAHPPGLRVRNYNYQNTLIFSALLRKKDVIMNISSIFLFWHPLWFLFHFHMVTLILFSFHFKTPQFTSGTDFLVGRWPQLLLSPACTKIIITSLAHISSGLLNVVREVGFPDQEHGILSLPLFLSSKGSSILVGSCFGWASGDWADTSHVLCTCCSGIWLPALLPAKLCLPCRACQGLEWAISFTSPSPVTILNLLTHVPINYWYNDALFRLVSADIITRQTFARQADR